MKIELAPSLDRFVEEKIQTGDFVDAGEVVRETLRRWKDQEESLVTVQDWLEGEIQEGLESDNLKGGKDFWKRLRAELHRGHKRNSRSR